MLRGLMIAGFMILSVGFCYSQTDSSGYEPPKYDYQIYLKKPAKEIRELLNYKDCTPIKGSIPENGNKLIMQDYTPGNKVYVRILYTDGTEEEFVRSPCFIDPVIL